MGRLGGSVRKCWDLISSLSQLHAGPGVRLRFSLCPSFPTHTLSKKKRERKREEFGQIQHFHDKILNKLETEGNLFNLIKDINEKPIASII